MINQSTVDTVSKCDYERDSAAISSIETEYNNGNNHALTVFASAYQKPLLVSSIRLPVVMSLH
jgi:hypothetical protein